MSKVSTRRMVGTDRTAVTHLLDDAMGRGFWNPSSDLEDIVIVALEGRHLIGVAVARVELDTAGANGALVGEVRLVAVAESARRRGIGTRLVREATAACEQHGATELIAYAWVHGPGGLAPLAQALKRAGYARERRIDDFYGGVASCACPACAQSPCVCPADVYRLTLSGDRG